MWQQSACLILLLATSQLCTARPQEHTGPVVQSARLASDDTSFFKPGAWRPVVSSASGDDSPRLRIDQDRSRVRLERGDVVRRVARSEPVVQVNKSQEESRKKSPSGPSPTPLGESIHLVTSQLLGTDQQESTPPKNKAKEEEHQGVAVPVILEDHELDKVEEVLLARRPSTSPTSKPEAGLSTWVLLSGSSAPSTVSSGKVSPTAAPSKKQNATTPTPVTSKKTPRPAVITTTKPKIQVSRKPASVATTAAPKQTVTTTKKPPTPVEKVNKTSISTKNKTGGILDVALLPALTRKPLATTPKPTEETATTEQPSTIFETTIKISTVAPVDNSTSLVTEEAADNSTETTTKRSRRPGSGSKKKKKNKRRKNRPSTSSEPESKITEESSNSTKVTATVNRPLSTRIYNYLAREVMPSVGVGLLGLVVTAGLAGLIMYPFGGGLAAKRTYDEADTTSGMPPHGNFYYYDGQYDRGSDSGQAEEEVIKHVFEGMNTGEDRRQEAQYDTQDTRYTSTQEAQDSRIANGQVTSYAGDVQATRHSGSNTRGSTNRRGETGGKHQSNYNPSNTQSYKYPSNQDYQYRDTTNVGRVTYSVGTTSDSSTSTDSENNRETGRVRFREIGSDGTNIKNNQKTNTQPTESGRVRYREVGSGAVISDTSNDEGKQRANPTENFKGRVRFREVGSDTVHYKSIDRSSQGMMEQGPRNLRMRRQISDEKRSMVVENNDMFGNEIDMEVSKIKNKQNKKEQITIKPTKFTKDEVTTVNSKIISDDKMGTNSKSSSVEITTDSSPAEEITVPLVEKTTQKSNTEDEKTENINIEDETTPYDQETTTIDTEHDKISEELNTEKSSAQISSGPDDIETLTESDDDSVTTVFPETVSDDDEGSQISGQEPLSFMNLVKQVAQFKIRFGLNLLKSTSQAFTRYLDRVQKRMETAVAEARQARYKPFPRNRRTSRKM